MSLAARASSPIGTRASQYGSENEADNLCSGLAVLRTAGWADILNSPHPSSREGHHSTTRWSSSFLHRSDLSRLSCRYRGLFPGPPELAAVNPDVQDHGQPTRQRDDRFSNRPVGSSAIDYPSPRCRCRSRARASLRNRHQGPSNMDLRTRRTIFAAALLPSDSRSGAYSNSPHPSSREGHHSTTRWSRVSSYRI